MSHGAQRHSRAAAGREVIPGYAEAVSRLVESTFLSSDIEGPRTLLSDSLPDLLQGQFGCEVANLYFHDQHNDTFLLFRDAVPEGIDLPAFIVREPSKADARLGRRFGFKIRPRQALEDFRNSRPRLLSSEERAVTVRLSYENLTSPTPRRSTMERDLKWLFVGSGERALFCFEWLVLMELERVAKEQGKRIGRAQAVEYVTSEFIQSIWNPLYSGSTEPYGAMRGRGKEDYVAALDWLEDVTKSKAEYRYLWKCPDAEKNWFIRGAREVRSVLSKAPRRKVDHETLVRLARLAITHSHANTSDEVSLASASFLTRTRVSPWTVLQLGTHNVATFRITGPATEETGPIDSFVLAHFCDSDVCQRYGKELRDLFSLIAARDVYRFSAKSIARGFRRAKHTTEILLAMSDYVFQHEFTSPFRKIRDATNQILKASASGGDLQKIRDKASEIQFQRERATRATQTLFGVTQSLTGRAKVIDLGKTVENLVQNQVPLETKKPPQVTVEVPRSKETIFVNVPNDALRLLLVNLIGNAYDALRERSHGTVRVRVRKMGGAANLVVEDDGPGIHKKVKEKIFTPFVSTKDRSRGMGLGLHICRSLVEMYEGTISVDEVEPHGARFAIVLPLARDGSPTGKGESNEES